MIIGSYALRNHRVISDLDIVMNEEEFDKLGDIGEKQLYNNQTRWFLDMTEAYERMEPTATDFSIEIFRKKPTEGYPDDRFSLGELKSNEGLDVDEFGHQFMNFDTLLKWKKTMNRDKDRADIKLIEGLVTQ